MRHFLLAMIFGLFAMTVSAAQPVKITNLVVNGDGSATMTLDLSANAVIAVQVTKTQRNKRTYKADVGPVTVLEDLITQTLRAAWEQALHVSLLLNSRTEAEALAFAEQMVKPLPPPPPTPTPDP